MSGRKTKFLLILGLLLGALSGFFILWLKAALSREIHTLLNDEVKKSCESCRFDAAELNVDLLSLTARARNATIFDGQIAALTFEKVLVKVSLAEITKRVLILEHIRLINGDVSGIDEKSAAFRLIDHLTSPLPSDSAQSAQLKVKLNKLSIENSSLKEDLGDTTLLGEKINLLLLRTESGDFSLTASIESSSLIYNKAQSVFELGRLEAALVFLDEQISFESLKLLQGGSIVELKGVSFNQEGNRLAGEISHQIKAEDIGFEAGASFTIDGTGKVSGKLAEPRLRVGFEAKDEVILFPREITGLVFNSLKGAYTIEVKSGSVSLALSELSADSPLTSINLLRPLTHEDGRTNGALGAEVQKVAGHNLSAEGIRIRVDINDSQLSLSSDIELFTVGPVELPDVHLGAIEQSGKLQIALKQSNVSGSAFLDTKSLHLTNGELVANNLKLFAHDSEQYALNLKVDFEGPLDTARLKLNGEFSLAKLESESKLGQGSIDLEKSILSIEFRDNNEPLLLKLKTDFSSSPAASNLELSLASPDLSDYHPQLGCFKTKAFLSYSFLLSQIAAGTGHVELNALEIGCDNALTLKEPVRLSIQNGLLKIPSSFIGNSSLSLELKGTVSQKEGFDLRASGTTDLSQFLFLLPHIDDLAGILDATLDIKGAIERPLFYGEARLLAAELMLESADFWLSEVEGVFNIQEEAVKLDFLKGKLNDGPFKASGVIYPFSIEASTFSLDFSELLLEPTENSSALISGSLNLSQGEGGATPLLSGVITVQNGDFRRNIDFRSLIRALTNLIFQGVYDDTRRELQELPNIGLNLLVEASHNLFVLTNVLNAELSAKFYISGLLSSPEIQGRMETLSGWFGLGDRRFEITAGHIFFRPGQVEPQLELVAESYMRSAFGDNILVILDATGPLTSPRVTLSSDHGLSQEEILQLVTGSGDFSGDAVVGTVASLVEMDNFTLINNETELGRLLRTFTTLDSLSLEPAYNIRRGSIDPTLVAVKKIGNALTVTGESFLGGSENESRLTLGYTLTPAIGISATMDTLSSDENLALGANITYTILGRQRNFLNISLSGNHLLKSADILEAVRLSNTSRLPKSELSKFERAISSFYSDSGFFRATVSLSCSVVQAEYCRSLEIEIEEGPRSILREISWNEDPELFGIIRPDRLLALPRRKTYATASFLNDRRSKLIKVLRSEGYIGARVEGKYQIVDQSQIDATNEVRLYFEITKGRPVTFSFNGNRAFSAEDFLKTINLFGRRQPFGPNTIKILTANIQELYLRAGYYFVQVSRETQEERDSRRIHHIISILEGPRVRVSGVELLGNQSLSTERLSSLAESSLGSDLRNVIFNTDAIVPETLAKNARRLEEIYAQQGFPQAQVEFSIEHSTQAYQAKVIYLIKEGEPLFSKELVLRGLPLNFRAPPLPSSPVSIPRVNEYITLLVDDLMRRGYQNPSITSSMENDSFFVLEVDAGVPTTVGNVIVEGNINIKEHVITEALDLKEGDLWNTDRLNKSRREVLRLGLFSRADLVPVESEKENQNDLLIRVSERPLRTLELGSGLNSEYGVRLFGEASDKKTFRDGKTLSARADTFYDPSDGGISKGIAGLRFLDPRFLESSYTLTEDLRYQKINLRYQEYDLDRYSLASYLSRSVNRWTYSFGHTLSLETFDDVSPDAILSDLDYGQLFLSYISGILSFDRRDNPLNPRQGYNINLNTLLATEALGSEASFFSLGTRASFIHPFNMGPNRFSLALGGRVASSFTFAGTEEVPISHRYYLGGRGTVRGFRENSLGPRGELGSVLGGDLLLASNLELRYHPTEHLSLHTFVDAGTVFLRSQGVNAGDIRKSSGLGFRYLSPIGPIGFDLGFPLDEKPGEPSMRLHFVIGSQF